MTALLINFPIFITSAGSYNFLKKIPKKTKNVAKTGIGRIGILTNEWGENKNKPQYRGANPKVSN